jgi:hypothetical protein
MHVYSFSRQRLPLCGWVLTSNNNYYNWVSFLFHHASWAGLVSTGILHIELSSLIILAIPRTHLTFYVFLEAAPRWN